MTKKIQTRIIRKDTYNVIKNQIDGDTTYIDFIINDTTMRINTDDTNNIIKLLHKYLHNLDSLICLDFHGVTDLYNLDEMIPSKLPKIIISYIGGSPKTIQNTTNTIKHRIISGEVILGIIVYKKNNIPSCGTKGWIISKFIDVNKNIKIHFLDDSKKNIDCINNIGSHNITTHYVNKNKNPKKYLTKILNTIL
jgi:hypothetical protein